MQRSGISLMEVLISIFVIAIGLLGIAALIPVANYALIETGKSDRTAACGQAAMRDVRVRALADPEMRPLVLKSSGTDYTNSNGASYVIDPLGNTTVDFGQVPVVTYESITAAMRDSFYWNDGLLFDMLEGSDNRPRGFDLDGDNIPDGPMPDQSYSWFLTVTPSPMASGAGGARRQFTVSVAVCYQRTLDMPNGGITLGGASGNLVLVMPTSAGTIISGVQLTGSQNVETGQWVLLSGPREKEAAASSVNVAQWYRVTAGYDEFFTLEGPNWPSTGDTHEIPNQLVIVPGVLGVYTTTFEVNHTSAWLR